MASRAGVAIQGPVLPEDKAGLRRAIAGAAERSGERSTSVTIGVSGGMPTERYLCEVTLDAGGHGSYRLVDELNDRSRPEASFRVDLDDAARVFEILQSVPILNGESLARFVPDALVGFVRVRAGELEQRVFFPVWENAPGEEPDHAHALPLMGDRLRIEPHAVPWGIPHLFHEISAVATRAAADEDG